MSKFNVTQDYYDFCDVLHQKWFDKSLVYESEVLDLFDIEYSPEPYFILKQGSNPLYMLLTNPGAGMDFQRHDNFSKSDYRNFAKALGDIYTSDQFKVEGGLNAHRRLTKSIDFARYLGFDGIVNIETIPFHSPNLDKTKALNAIGKSWILSRYQEVLSNFLSDKPVLIVSACNSKSSISMDTLRDSPWLMYQIELASINIESLKFKEITRKNSKITSAMFYDGMKHIVLTMGSNNLPSI